MTSPTEPERIADTVHEPTPEEEESWLAGYRMACECNTCLSALIDGSPA